MEFEEFGSLGQEPNNSVYLTPLSVRVIILMILLLTQILCSNCGEDHASGQFFETVPQNEK